MQRTNGLGQPVGVAVEDWVGASSPDRVTMEGPRCRLVPLDAERHAKALHEAYAEDRDGGNWTYLPYGPFESAREYADWVRSVQAGEDPVFFAIVDCTSGSPVGVASYLRAVPAMGTIEVGHLNFSPALQRTAISTEAMYLMMRRVFDVWGYRRYEWKCDRLNGPSVTAAQRLGFRYEGTFRNHVVTKGRNRDTAWFSVTDAEWPGIRMAMEAWLDPVNFDDRGGQHMRLAGFMPASAGKALVVDADTAPGSHPPSP